MAISIHAPRTGSDWERVGMGADRTISIHAPRTGSDESYFDSVPHKATFQSTLPARGATDVLPHNIVTGKAFQSTLPARGATGRRSSCQK